MLAGVVLIPSRRMCMLIKPDQMKIKDRSRSAMRINLNECERLNYEEMIEFTYRDRWHQIYKCSHLSLVRMGE